MLSFQLQKPGATELDKRTLDCSTTRKYIIKAPEESLIHETFMSPKVNIPTYLLNRNLENQMFYVNERTSVFSWIGNKFLLI